MEAMTHSSQAGLASIRQPNINELIRAAKADAWDEGARWAGVELGVYDAESTVWLTDGDNPYLDPTAPAFEQVAADMNAAIREVADASSVLRVVSDWSVSS